MPISSGDALPIVPSGNTLPGVPSGNTLPSSGDVLPGQDTGVRPNPLSFLASGARKSIVGTAARAAGYDPLKEYADLQPGSWKTLRGAGEHVAELVGENVPDLVPLIVTGGAAALEEAPLKLLGTKALQEAVEKGTLSSIGKIGLKAAGGASVVGAMEGVRSPLEQYADTGKVDPVKVLKDTGAGAVGGAIGGGVLGAAGEGVSKLLNPGNTVSDKAASTVRQIMTEAEGKFPYEGNSGAEVATDSANPQMAKRQYIVDRFKQEGIDHLLKPQKQSVFSDLLNGKTYLNNVERTTGIPVGSLVDTGVGLENSLSHDIIDYNIKKVDFLSKYKGYDMGRLKQLLDGEIKPSMPIDTQILNDYNGPEGLTEWMHKLGTEKYGLDIGHRENYSSGSMRPEFGFSWSEPLDENGKLKVGSASFQKKYEGKVPDFLKEQDPIKRLDNNMTRMKQQVLKDKLIPEFRDNIQRLKMMNQTNIADKVEKMASDYFGGSGGRSNKVFVDYYLKKDWSGDIEGLLSAADSAVKKPLLDRVMANLNDTFYTGSITANPRIWLAHAMQPETMGVGDGLGKWLIKARKNMLFKGGQYADSLAKNVPEITTGYLDPQERQMFNAATQQQDPAFFRMLKKIGAPLDRGFTGLMNYNRKVLFLAGKDRATSEGITEGLLKPLLTGEKRQVVEAMAKGGIEAASDTYGQIMANRNMFIFSSLDKPEVLRGAIGKYIPFTTWARNTVMRTLEDVQAGNVNNIAKRLAYAYMMDKTFQGLTGFQLKGMNPYDAKEQLMKLPFMPVATGVIQPALAGNAGNAIKGAVRSGLGPIGSVGAKAYGVMKDSEPGAKALKSFMGLTPIGGGLLPMGIKALQGTPSGDTLPGEIPSGNQLPGEKLQPVPLGTSSKLPGITASLNVKLLKVIKGNEGDKNVVNTSEGTETKYGPATGNLQYKPQSFLTAWLLPENSDIRKANPELDKAIKNNADNNAGLGDIILKNSNIVEQVANNHIDHLKVLHEKVAPGEPLSNFILVGYNQGDNGVKTYLNVKDKLANGQPIAPKEKKIYNGAVQYLKDAYKNSGKILASL